MIKAIITGIFSLITSMFDLLLSPVLSLIYNLFPSLTNFFNYISSFLNMSFTYVRSCLSLFLITDTMITTLFDYFLILYSIYLITLAVRFAINVYNKFKL